MSALIETAELAERLNDPEIRIVDGSWYLPRANRDARAEFGTAHIPGARYFDLDEIADHTTDLPHMLPPAPQFEAAMSALGIGQEHHVVIYDGAGLFSAPRVWWTFRVFGHARVSVLNGGLPKWQAEGRPMTDEVPTSVPIRYTAHYQPALVRQLDDIKAIVDDGSAQMLDARSEGRFRGQTPEPRPNTRGGHMPGSLNLPYAQLVQDDGTLVPKDKLETLVAQAGIDRTRPIVTTCGSGVTAALLALALFELGHSDVPVYDGSWAQWGGRSETPIKT